VSKSNRLTSEYRQVVFLQLMLQNLREVWALQNVSIAFTAAHNHAVSEIENEIERLNSASTEGAAVLNAEQAEIDALTRLGVSAVIARYRQSERESTKWMEQYHLAKQRIAVLEKRTADDNQEWQNKFKGVASRFIGRYLKVSTPTIERYFEGKSSPHPLAQEQLLEELGKANLTSDERGGCDQESGYCKACGSCGEDGCCPAELCQYPGIKSETLSAMKEIAERVCTENEELKGNMKICVEALEKYAALKSWKDRKTAGVTAFAWAKEALQKVLGAKK
jgi:predicted RNA-binding protein with PIN domain